MSPTNFGTECEKAGKTSFGLLLGGSTLILPPRKNRVCAARNITHRRRDISAIQAAVKMK